MQKNNYMDIMEKNHMEIPWHDYTENDSNVLINKAGLRRLLLSEESD